MDLIPHLRPAAYALCIADDRILLARGIGPEGPQWTIPGGGLDHGEDPYDGALREVTEETGYTVAIAALLGVDSLRMALADPPWDFHALRFVYLAHVVGGELRYEVDGSTDMAAWIPLAEVADTERTELVDISLRLYRERPVSGHLS